MRLLVQMLTALGTERSSFEMPSPSLQTENHGNMKSGTGQWSNVNSVCHNESLPKNTKI